MEFSGLEDVTAFIEENHQGSRFCRQGKSLLVLRNGEVVELGPRPCGDFDLHRDAKEAHTAFDLLDLCDGKHHLVLCPVVGVAQVEFRRACAVEPLTEELVNVDMRRFFNGLGKIGGHYALASIYV